MCRNRCVSIFTKRIFSITHCKHAKLHNLQIIIVLNTAFSFFSLFFVPLKVTLSRLTPQLKILRFLVKECNLISKI